MNEKVYGYTKSGEPINEEMIEHFVEEADKGYDDGRLKSLPRGRGRPPLGDAAKVVGSLRLDPTLRREAEFRANAEGVSVSELLRRALQEYLNVAKFSGELQQHRFFIPQTSIAKVDETDFPKRLSSAQRRLVLEIERGFNAARSEYSQWLDQFSRVYRELSADIQNVIDIDIGAKRDSAEKIVKKVQTISSSQLTRMKALIEEGERFLSRWDEFGNSKSGRRR